MNVSSSQNAPTILLVEDDEQVRAMVRGLLLNNGFQVLEAATGRDGVQAALQHGSAIDLLISDMLLPELSGYDLAVEVRRHYPSIKILFMTGYVEGEIVQRCVSELGAGFLDKPFRPAELLHHVREATGKDVATPK